MFSFNKPNKLNGVQLNNELIAAGIKLVKSNNDLLDEIYEAPTIDGNGVLWLNIDETDVQKATEIVNLHIGNDPATLSVEQKLAKVGLNLEDLKAALNFA